MSQRKVFPKPARLADLNRYSLLKAHFLSSKVGKAQLVKGLTLSVLLGASGLLTACSKEPEVDVPSTEVTDVPAQTTAKTPITTDSEVADTETKMTDAGGSVIENQSSADVTTAQEAQDTDIAAVNDTPLAADAGKALYEKRCQVCHATGMLEAPKMGDKAAWAPHIAKGMPTLYKHSAAGFNKMPPQAVDDISEAQVHAAVDYMVAASS